MDLAYAERDKNSVYEKSEIKYIPGTYDKAHLEWFLTEFDTKETMELYRNEEHWLKQNERVEEIEMDIYTLQESTTSIPNESDPDWRNGIKRAAERYYRNRTIAILPDVVELYRKRRAAKEPVIKDDAEGRHITRPIEDYLGLRNNYFDHILRGRELKGEPRNLDF